MQSALKPILLVESLGASCIEICRTSKKTFIGLVAVDCREPRIFSAFSELYLGMLTINFSLVKLDD